MTRLCFGPHELMPIPFRLKNHLNAVESDESPGPQKSCNVDTMIEFRLICIWYAKKSLR